MTLRCLWRSWEPATTPMPKPHGASPLLIGQVHMSGHSPTFVTSQLPIKAWHDAMQDPTLADAILDRLVHNASKVELKGESMRKKRLALAQKTDL